MKYYEKIPENFLLIRLVPTRMCNYSCPYCYLSKKERRTPKNMFSHYQVKEWLNALKNNFKNKKLEFYFTGGEPLMIEDCLFLIKELISWDNVLNIRIDSNLALLDNFLDKINSPKISFLVSFHPLELSFDELLRKIKVLQSKNMLGMVNFVASVENLRKVNMSVHKLVKQFESHGVFLNIAKDFERGLFKSYGYDEHYKKYVDMFQYPLDNFYMNMHSLNNGFLCGSGKHYITINRHGDVFSCGNEHRRSKGHGNIFANTLNLPKTLNVCEESACASIVSYSFSLSNEFLPINHIQDYCRRCDLSRQSLSVEYLDKLWAKIDINKIFRKKMKPLISNGLKKIFRRLFLK